MKNTYEKYKKPIHRGSVNNDSKIQGWNKCNLNYAVHDDNCLDKLAVFTDPRHAFYSSNCAQPVCKEKRKVLHSSLCNGQLYMPLSLQPISILEQISVENVSKLFTEMSSILEKWKARKMRLTPAFS